MLHRIVIPIICVNLIIMLSCCHNQVTPDKKINNQDSSKILSNYKKNSTTNQENITPSNGSVNPNSEEYYVKDINNSNLLDLSFCLDTLLYIMHENYDDYSKKWKDEQDVNFDELYNKEYIYPLEKGSLFFLKTLKKNKALNELYPKEVAFLINSIKLSKDTFASNQLFQTHMQYYLMPPKYSNGGNDMGSVSDRSSIIYTYLITDGYNFIRALEGNKKSVDAYKKWLTEIESNEFTSSEIVTPDRIMHLEKDYIVKELSIYNGKDSLVYLTLKKLKKVKIRGDTGI